MSSQYNMEGQKNDASRNDERRPSNDESREDEKHPHNDATRNDERRPGNDESRNDGSHRNSDAPRNDESSPNNDESREDEMHPNNDATRNDERRPNNGEQGAPANDQQALMRPDVNIRDENIARELRVASFQKWQKVYKAAVGNWVAIGKPPCKTCKKTHPPPHTTNAQRAELGQLKKFGHELCGDPEAPQCQRCRKSHYGKCRALPCGSCGQFHAKKVACSATEGFQPLHPQQQQQQQQQQPPPPPPPPVQQASTAKELQVFFDVVVKHGTSFAAETLAKFARAREQQLPQQAPSTAFGEILFSALMNQGPSFVEATLASYAAATGQQQPSQQAPSAVASEWIKGYVSLAEVFNRQQQPPPPAPASAPAPAPKRKRDDGGEGGNKAPPYKYRGRGPRRR
ncbi:hypothetical protein HDK77DRAFT_153534 [Phyllosticta capitalensis]